MKKAVIFFYIATVAVMAAATIFGHYKGEPFAQANIYGAWWFSLLWALLAAAGIMWIIKRKALRPGLVAIHLSMVIILAGALITHLTAKSGYLHLREGEKAVDTFKSYDDSKTYQLPFKVELKKFDIIYHQGTDAVNDYVSKLNIIDNGTMQEAQVSMNKISSYHNVRLLQSSYDSDGKGTVLSVNIDPWGIGITYLGYALFFLSLIWMLIDPKGTFRKLLKSPLLKAAGMVCLMLFPASALNPAKASAASSASEVKAADGSTLMTVPKETADKFGQLLVNYNDRICPVQTLALDFLKKINGSRSYKGLSPEQVMLSYIYYTEQWDNEPLIKVKNGALRKQLQLKKYSTVADFFTNAGGYRLAQMLTEYYNNNVNDAMHKEAAKIDEKLMLIMSLRQSEPLKLFPIIINDRQHPHDYSNVVWASPTDKKIGLIKNKDEQLFIRHFFPLIYEALANGNTADANMLMEKMGKYQRKQGGQSIPDDSQLTAEKIYNAVPFATVLFMLNLTMGIISLLLLLFYNENKTARIIAYAIMLLSFAALTLAIALRWIIGGTVPMSNGYETMLLVAWIVMLTALLFSHRIQLLLPFGFIISGFFLLVSHINQMDPQISHIMPVLNSPLLSVHVSIIMAAYALLSITFLCSLSALICKIWKKTAVHEERLTLTSRLFLFPSLTFLGIGIFTGAIWANVSWGQYWSWDPKEVWALITMMVYAAAVHTASLPAMRRPNFYNVYVATAFLTIIMTYFGVNYILGGMHSYA